MSKTKSKSSSSSDNNNNNNSSSSSSNEPELQIAANRRKCALVFYKDLDVLLSSPSSDRGVILTGQRAVSVPEIHHLVRRLHIFPGIYPTHLLLPGSNSVLDAWYQEIQQNKDVAEQIEDDMDAKLLLCERDGRNTNLNHDDLNEAAQLRFLMEKFGLRDGRGIRRDRSQLQPLKEVLGPDLNLTAAAASKQISDAAGSNESKWDVPPIAIDSDLMFQRVETILKDGECDISEYIADGGFAAGVDAIIKACQTFDEAVIYLIKRSGSLTTREENALSLEKLGHGKHHFVDCIEFPGGDAKKSHDNVFAVVFIGAFQRFVGRLGVGRATSNRTQKSAEDDFSQAVLKEMCHLIWSQGAEETQKLKEEYEQERRDISAGVKEDADVFYGVMGLEPGASGFNGTNGRGGNAAAATAATGNSADGNGVESRVKRSFGGGGSGLQSAGFGTGAARGPDLSSFDDFGGFGSETGGLSEVDQAAFSNLYEQDELQALEDENFPFSGNTGNMGNMPNILENVGYMGNVPYRRARGDRGNERNMIGSNEIAGGFGDMRGKGRGTENLDEKKASGAFDQHMDLLLAQQLKEEQHQYMMPSMAGVGSNDNDNMSQFEEPRRRRANGRFSGSNWYYRTWRMSESNNNSNTLDNGARQDNSVDNSESKAGNSFDGTQSKWKM